MIFYDKQSRHTFRLKFFSLMHAFCSNSLVKIMLQKLSKKSTKKQKEKKSCNFTLYTHLTIEIKCKKIRQHLQIYQWRIQGVAMVSVTTPLKEHMPLISNNWQRKEQKLPRAMDSVLIQELWYWLNLFLSLRNGIKRW